MNICSALIAAFVVLAFVVFAGIAVPMLPVSAQASQPVPRSLPARFVVSPAPAPVTAPPGDVTPESVLAFLRATLALVWSYAGVKIIVGHTLINVVVALAAAQFTSSLDLSKLAEFLTKKLIPFIAVYVACKAFGDSAGLAWLAPAVWAIIESSLSANLLDNLAKLGVPLPDALARLVIKRTYIG